MNQQPALSPQATAVTPNQSSVPPSGTPVSNPSSQPQPATANKHVKFPDPVDQMAEQAAERSAQQPPPPETPPGRPIKLYLIIVAMICLIAGGAAFAYDQYLNNTVRKENSDSLVTAPVIDKSMIVEPDQLPEVTPTQLNNTLTNNVGTPFPRSTVVQDYIIYLPADWQAVPESEFTLRIEKYTEASGSGDLVVRPVTVNEIIRPQRLVATTSAEIAEFLDQRFPLDEDQTVTEQEELQYSSYGFPILDRTITNGEQINHELTVVLPELVLRFYGPQNDDTLSAMRSIVNSVEIQETANE